MKKEKKTGVNNYKNKINQQNISTDFHSNFKYQH